MRIFFLSSKQKLYLFLIAFFCLQLSLTACKKKKQRLGKEMMPAENIMGSERLDTFKIKTYTVEDGDINTMNPEFNLIGSYTDEIFGTVDAGFYTQLTLSGFSPDFGDLSLLSIDSAVMAFEYGGYYGKLNEQIFEVYEIAEDLSSDSVYTKNSTLQVNPLNLVPDNKEKIKLDVEKPAIVGNDTLMPQLRIQLNPDFAKNLLTIAANSNSDEVFLESFKGLYFKVNNPVAPIGEGAVVYLASSKSASKLTVYYTSNGENNKFDFIIPGKAVDFNHIKTDYTNTKVQDVIENHDLGNTEFYAQASSSRAKIEIESINNLPKDIIVHSAILEVPVSYYEGDNFYISSEVNVSAQLYEDDDNKYVISTVSYDKFDKAYIIDLRTYIQNIIKGEILNKGVFISPRRYNTSVERIIFNGVNTNYKKQPKLTVIFTKI